MTRMPANLNPWRPAISDAQTSAPVHAFGVQRLAPNCWRQRLQFLHGGCGNLIAVDASGVSSDAGSIARTGRLQGRSSYLPL